MRDEIQVGNTLHILREKLKKAGVIDGMVIVMAGVHIQCVLGHGAAGHVQHVGQPFAHRRVQRLVHIGNALAAGEVG